MDAEPHAGVGFRTRRLDVADAVQQASIRTVVSYPSEPSSRHPVIVVSHGSGGTPLAAAGLAQFLSAHGFVVARLAHPGNTRGDDALANSPVNLVNRPRHARLVLDAVLADPELAPIAAADRAVVIGHSYGGYTALAISGGKPLALPDQTADAKAHPVEVERDPRVCAAVLLAPALPWFIAPGALADVTVPLLVRTGERDPLAPPFFVEQVLRGLPSTTRMDYAVVPNAGHFAWSWPLSPALVAAKLPPALDPPGFDREAYQATHHAEVLAFLLA